MPWTVPYNELRWFQENQPERMTTIYTTLYDQDGVEHIVRGYECEMWFRRGWTIVPPGEEQISPEEVTPEEPEERPYRRPMVRSRRGG